jgi:asparagine synthase (glutamine-hydrolysing)
MRYRYLALTGDLESQPIDVLLKLGMGPRCRVGPLTLFASSETPVLSLPSGGVVLGDLYLRDGSAVTDLSALQCTPNQRVLRQHLLDHYWGEYLLIQPGDERSDGLTVMRDPSGGIACAYSLKQGFLTSDLSIPSRLGLHHDQVDWEFVRHCLLYPYMKISRTGLADVNELLPGCVLSMGERSASTTVAWTPWRFVMMAERQRDPDTAARTIRHVTTSVVRAMAETDRAVLLQLSGGLDSSIVGVCLADIQARVSCCTLVTPLPGADERRYARQITDQLGVELLQQSLDFEHSGIDFPLPRHSLRPAIWALGRSVAHALDKAPAAQEASSLFSGAGGDAVFCYLGSAVPAVDAFRAQGLATSLRAINNLSKLHGCTVAKAARLMLRKLSRPIAPPFRPDDSLLRSSNAAPPLDQHPWFSAPEGALPGDRERIFNLAGNQLFPESTLQGDADHRRIRMPLLSQPVMEACLRIPSWMWISGGKNRAIARAAFADRLPEEVLNRRSKGTFMNYNFALYQRNRETIRHFLLDGHLHSHGLLDSNKLNAFLDSQQPARDHSFMRVFTLCMVENWVRNHT